MCGLLQVHLIPLKLDISAQVHWIWIKWKQHRNWVLDETLDEASDVSTKSIWLSPHRKGRQAITDDFLSHVKSAYTMKVFQDLYSFKELKGGCVSPLETRDRGYKEKTWPLVQWRIIINSMSAESFGWYGWETSIICW